MGADNVVQLPLTPRETELLKILSTTTGDLDYDVLAKTLHCSVFQVKSSLRALGRKGRIGQTVPGAAQETPVPTVVSFTVVGRPRPQGSKDIVSGRAGRAQVVESSRYLEAWRETIIWAANGHMPRVPWDCPVELTLRFFFRRPESARWERPTAPPDIDKLERAVLDSLQKAGLMRNDSQVCRVFKDKLWSPDGIERLELVARAMPDPPELDVEPLEARA